MSAAKESIERAKNLVSEAQGMLAGLPEPITRDADELGTIVSDLARATSELVDIVTYLDDRLAQHFVGAQYDHPELMERQT
jgi:hypothetical protein